MQVEWNVPRLVGDIKTLNTPFLAKFNNDINQLCQIIQQRNANFTAQISQLKAKHDEIQREIQKCEQNHQNVLNELQRHSQQEQEMIQTIQQLNEQKTRLEERKKQLELKAKQVERELEEKQRLMDQQRHFQSTQSAKNEPELYMFEDVLGLKIVGASEGILSFIFDHIDPKNHQREFRFTVDVASSDHTYALVECVPMVPNVEVQMQRLNQSRDFYGFVKSMRASFCANK